MWKSRHARSLERLGSSVSDASLRRRSANAQHDDRSSYAERHGRLYGGPLEPLITSSETRVIFQGFTGRVATQNAKESIAYGTKIVGGVTPGRSGEHLGLPLYSTLQEAQKYLKADATAIFVPATGAARAIEDAIEAELPLIVAVAEHIPVHDTMRIVQILNTVQKSRLVGPNTPGLISPLHGCRIGFQPLPMYKPGHVAVIAKSGTLSYEAVGSLSRVGVGQSHCVGVGGDPVRGTGLVEAFNVVDRDADTHAIVVIGEVGGIEEMVLADLIKARTNAKPVVALVAGRSIPEKLVMGHAGAFLGITDPSGEVKHQALRDAGATMVDHPEDIGPAMQRLLADMRPSTPPRAARVPNGRRAFHTTTRPTETVSRVSVHHRRLHLTGSAAAELLSGPGGDIKVDLNISEDSPAGIPIGVTIDRRSGQFALWIQPETSQDEYGPEPLAPGVIEADEGLIRSLLQSRRPGYSSLTDPAACVDAFQYLLDFSVTNDALSTTAVLSSSPSPSLSALTIHIDDSAHRTCRRQGDTFDKYLGICTPDTRSLSGIAHGIIYATLPSPDARIGTIVNGAGLAMNTLDRLRLPPHSAPCVNFLDTGGKATAATVKASFELVLSDPRTRVVLVNIFGGLTDCGMIADGIVLASREVDMRGVPIVVRLRGTNEAVGQRRIADSGLGLEVFDGFAEAAARVVELAYPERSGDPKVER